MDIPLYTSRSMPPLPQQSTLPIGNESQLSRKAKPSTAVMQTNPPNRYERGARESIAFDDLEISKCSRCLKLCMHPARGRATCTAPSRTREQNELFVTSILSFQPAYLASTNAATQTFRKQFACATHPSSGRNCRGLPAGAQTLA